MKWPSPPGIFPVRSFDVLIEKSEHDRFVEQMRRFGAAFGFRMVIKPSSPRPYDTYVQMFRHDVDLSATNGSDTGALNLKFGIGFYPKRGQPAENLAPLVEGLLVFLDAVPGATVTDVTKRR